MLSHGHGSHIHVNLELGNVHGVPISTVHGFHTQHAMLGPILSIVWGPHIYMPSVKVSMYLLPHGIIFLEVYVE